MSSIKCPECGLVNFASAKSCKRCGHLLAQKSSRIGSAPTRADVIERGPSRVVWVKAIQIGIICTILGMMYVYLDGLFSFKALVPLFGIGLIVLGCLGYQSAKRRGQVPKPVHRSDKLSNEDTMASPLQLKITGAYLVACGLACIAWGDGWLINGLPLRAFGCIVASAGICFVVFSNSLTLRSSIPRISSRRG